MILEGPDVRLNYEVIGEGSPVTLLHGFTQSGRSWHEVISLMPDGWRWILPDLRGHGATRVRSGAPYTMDACTADLELLWDSLGIARTLQALPIFQTGGPYLLRSIEPDQYIRLRRRFQGASDERLVHRRRALHHDRVHGYLLAWLDCEDVPYYDLLDVDLGLQSLLVNPAGHGRP